MVPTNLKSAIEDGILRVDCGCCPVRFVDGRC
jgi:hypothetical protein